MAERLIGIIGGSGLYEMEGLEVLRERACRRHSASHRIAMSSGGSAGVRSPSWPATGEGIA